VLRHAIETQLPFLAICRGMQLLNVARGGILVQHLPDVIGHDGHQPVPGRMARHRVQISTTSTLGKLLGSRLDVATYHHQAVERLGKGLLAVAWTDDQVVEAVELQGHPFGLGVQWHPEEDTDLRLFEALTDAALGERGHVASTRRPGR
jgi:putative glutamine amidotransferase